MFINHLEPVSVWRYFEEICKIPRLSKNEAKIRTYLKDFAKENKLEVKEDSVGNILIIREADPDHKHIKSVVLQSHMDMVGEKDANTNHDWDKDPIKPIIKNGWVTAEVTTLGADDGIGIAAQMAILTDKNIKCGKIECLFTVDEETGMTGAINLEPGFFESKILLNLDSEDEGELFIGCAGGIDTVSNFKYETEKTADNSIAFNLSITGLHGGHSGDEIHNGYANSVKIVTDILIDLISRFDIQLAAIDAGNLRNAIPREAFATFVAKEGLTEDINTRIKDLRTQLRAVYIISDSKLSIELIKSKVTPEMILTKDLQSRLLQGLKHCPHGVIAWSQSMKDLVETSTNLASVKIQGDSIKVVTSQRSSVDKAKRKIGNDIKKIFLKSGADVIHSDGYPGWEPNTESEILKVTDASYKLLFGEKAIVRAIHAGLECGLILEKYPELDMISFGPTIKGAHTPEEKINIVSTLKFWKLLIDVLNNIPSR